MYDQLLAVIHNAHPLLAAGMILLLGHAGALCAHRLGAPRVSGYLVTGMLLAPSTTGVLSEALVYHRLAFIQDMALGVIAISIGGTLYYDRMKRVGRQILWITLSESLGACLVTTIGLALLMPFVINVLGHSELSPEMVLPLAMLLGAISTATAPAATIAIIHELRAKGPLTTVLLGVVALDDAIAIIFYAIAMSVAATLVSGETFHLAEGLMEPFKHIALSVIIGAVACVVLWTAARFSKRASGLLVVTIGCVLATVGLSDAVNASALMACMVLGVGIVNLIPQSQIILDGVESVEEVIFSLFFVLAGAHLDLSTLDEAGALALMVVVLRFTGKLLGSKVGAVLTGAPETVRKYLGFCLLPKAGVNVGLVLLAKKVFGNHPVSDLMVNAVLASVILNELLSPIMVRYFLIRAGDATPE